jgi:predicted DNA-binding transcriptional regulator YafY
MRDENCLRRQWALLRALTSRHLGLTIRQMADEVGVTGRTIRRDFVVFHDVGFPLVEEVGDFGLKTWRIRGGRDQPALSFTFDEAAALYLGRRLLEPLAGTLLWEAARGAFQKIRAASPIRGLSRESSRAEEGPGIFPSYLHKYGPAVSWHRD